MGGNTYGRASSRNKQRQIDVVKQKQIEIYTLNLSHQHYVQVHLTQLIQSKLLILLIYRHLIQFHFEIHSFAQFQLSHHYYLAQRTFQLDKKQQQFQMECYSYNSAKYPCQSQIQLFRIPQVQGRDKQIQLQFHPWQSLFRNQFTPRIKSKGGIPSI